MLTFCPPHHAVYHVIFNLELEGMWWRWQCCGAEKLRFLINIPLLSPRQLWSVICNLPAPPALWSRHHAVWRVTRVWRAWQWQCHTALCKNHDYPNSAPDKWPGLACVTHYTVLHYTVCYSVLQCVTRRVFRRHWHTQLTPAPQIRGWAPPSHQRRAGPPPHICWYTDTALGQRLSYEHFSVFIQCDGSYRTEIQNLIDTEVTIMLDF